MVNKNYLTIVKLEIECKQNESIFDETKYNLTLLISFDVFQCFGCVFYYFSHSIQFNVVGIVDLKNQSERKKCQLVVFF